MCDACSCDISLSASTRHNLIGLRHNKKKNICLRCTRSDVERHSKQIYIKKIVINLGQLTGSLPNLFYKYVIDKQRARDLVCTIDFYNIPVLLYL